MRHYAWPKVPRDVKQQVESLLADLRGLLGPTLAGVYLYGSLAMGRFRRDTSDLDLLVVVKRRLVPPVKRRVAEALLRTSNRPVEIELSVLAPPDLHPWRYPSSYDFHYSEQHRVRYQRALRTRAWRRWRGPQGKDPDLAVDITLARCNSIPLLGRPAASTLPKIPEADFVDASLRDVEWARERLKERPMYAALNPCRILAYLETRRHLSRMDAGAWALGVVPARHHAVIRTALEAYRGRKTTNEIPRAALDAFTAYVKDRIAWSTPDSNRRSSGEAQHVRRPACDRGRP